MIDFTAGTSFCAYPRAEDIEVRMIPPALFSFRGAKQALRRGATIAARATSVAGFVLFAGLVAYNYASEYMSTRAAQKFAAEIDMSIDAHKASVLQAHAAGEKRYEDYVRAHIDAKFDLAAWNAAAKAAQKDLKQDNIASQVVVGEMVLTNAVIESVRYEVPPQTLVQAPVINAAYVGNMLGVQHPLVAKFKAEEAACPAAPITVQLDDICAKRMQPLYQQFGDAVVAQTKATSVAALASAKTAAAKRVSAPQTTLLKIQQPKQAAYVNRPVSKQAQVTDAKPYKKKMAAARPAKVQPQPFDAATFFSQMNHS